jgi:hypothetical protein
MVNQREQEPHLFLVLLWPHSAVKVPIHTTWTDISGALFEDSLNIEVFKWAEAKDVQ